MGSIKCFVMPDLDYSRQDRSKNSEGLLISLILIRPNDESKSAQEMIVK